MQPCNRCTPCCHSAVSCDGGFVHHGTYLALSVEGGRWWASGSCRQFVFVAVTAVLDDSGVVPTDDSLDIWHAAIAELDCVPVLDSLQSILPLWVGMVVKQAQKFLPNVG